MSFGKLIFGVLLLAAGGLLLAIRLGYAPPDTLAVLLPYWPLLLVAVGLAFLASAVKNAFLGFLAVFLILGGVIFGVFWTKSRHASGASSVRMTTYDLAKEHVTALTIRARTLGGGLTLDASKSGSALEVSLKHATGASANRQRFVAGGRAATYEWPTRSGALDLSPLGAELHVAAPRSLPIRLDCESRFSTTRFDLSGLRASRCDLVALGSSLRIGLGASNTQQLIRIRSHLSNARIILPDGEPIRLMFLSRWNTISVPADFVELATGRGKGKTYTSEGRGRMIQIVIEGELNNVRVERVPSRAI